MGSDFAAIFKCSAITDMDDLRLRAVETRPPDVVGKILAVFRSEGRSVAHLTRQEWRQLSDGFCDPVPRPASLTADISFHTADGFSLTFCPDGMDLYHFLRWFRFLTDANWQETMLNACRELARLVDASDAIITRDESPVRRAFFRGMPFEDALRQGQGPEGEVASVSDLYESIDNGRLWDSHGYWRLPLDSGLGPGGPGMGGGWGPTPDS